MAGVFEECGRHIVLKYLLKKDRTRENAVLYGIGHGGIEGMGSEVDKNRLETGGLAVGGGYAVVQHGVFGSAHGQHLHLAPGGEEALGDAVHGQGATVDGRKGRFAAELEYLHTAGVVTRWGGL